MSIESEIFKRSKLIKEKLIPYGFKKQGKSFLFSKNISDDTFKVVIEINADDIKGRIIEISTGEEYTNYRIKTIKGGFSANIKQEFIDILEDIKKNCFSQKFFILNQTNRICDWIIETYGDYPEFLWVKFQGTAVFRNKENEKWYAIILNVKRNKIDKGDDEIEIINLKLDEKEIESLISKEGFYKGYHMNKKSWISLILDDTLTDKTIKTYIKKSYENIKR